MLCLEDPLRKQSRCVHRRRSVGLLSERCGSLGHGVVSSRLWGAKSRTSEPRFVCTLPLLWKVRAGRSELAVVPENLNSGTCL